MFKSLLLLSASVWALSGTTAAATSFVYTGAVQTYTVATTGIYDVVAAGASGGGASPGAGIAIGAHVALTAGTVLDVVVGGVGGSNYQNKYFPPCNDLCGEGAAAAHALADEGNGGGGGGGSFILRTNFSPVVIGGGGGGGYATIHYQPNQNRYFSSGGSAVAGTAGTAVRGPFFAYLGFYYSGAGGKNGSGGSGGVGEIGGGGMGQGGSFVSGGGGGGLYGPGGTVLGGSGAPSFAGGVAFTPFGLGAVGYGLAGGFGGGGGGSESGAGGGGGFSGGGGGYATGGGGGGGSFTQAGATDITAIANPGANGFASIDFLSALPPVSALPEPDTWGLMLGGLGLIGAAMRRAKRAARIA